MTHAQLHARLIVALRVKAQLKALDTLSAKLADELSAREARAKDQPQD